MMALSRTDEGLPPSNSEPVQVIVRIRPEPGASTAPVVVARDERSVALLPLPSPPPDPTGKAKPAVDTKTFTFDKVYGPQATQAEVYEFARPLVLSAVEGYNSTIFAYGHTGSGKTHTMMGTPSQPGMTPLAVQEMFALIRRMSAREPDTIFSVRVSYVELYNNRFRNLLEGCAPRGGDAADRVGHVLGGSLGFGSSIGSGRGSWREPAGGGEALSLRSSWRSMTSPLGSSCGGGGGAGDGLSSRSCEGGLAALAASQRRTAAVASIAAGRNGKIEVRECPEMGVFLSGPGLRRPVTSAEEVLRLVARGDSTRATGATDCNEHSSRSHAILSLHVESQRVSSEGEALTVGRGDGLAKGRVRLGKLHLVDLAGSERLSLSGSEGKRLHETQNINLSLSSLGDVLACLSRNATITARRLARTKGAVAAAAVGGRGGDGDGIGDTVAPVPYRNSKLTHFLKDSLGGNSKTIMMTTLRSTTVYHRQSLISLMYASRAKKIRNQSSVNVDTAGQSNIHQVSAEIETLRHRLNQRSLELNRLHNAHLSGQAENASLRGKLQGLSSINERERAQLEGKLSTVIHSQAGKLAVQHQAFVSLQDRLQRQLGEYQKKCMLQQEEITHLRSTIETMERETGERVGGQEVQEMQRVVEAWQAQATEAQKELRVAITELETTRMDGLALKTATDRLTGQLKAAEARERALLGYWRQLQAAMGLGTHSPMPAETIIDAVNRLREGKSKEASARVRAEKARASAERAARDLAEGAQEHQELEERVAALSGEMEDKRQTLKDLVTANEQAANRLHQARKERAELEASVLREEARTNSARERLSKAEANLGGALEVEGLRSTVDEAQAAREAARTEATKTRLEMQEVTTSRDEALRSNEALRERLEEFERTLKDATEDAHALLDEKDAALRRVGSEREREREAHKQEVEELRRSIADVRGTASRFKTEVACARAAMAQHKEQAGAAATSAASSAASESAAKARVAVAIGARQDAEKTASALRERLLERDREVSSVRQELTEAISAVERLSRELDRSRASETENRRQVASATAAGAKAEAEARAASAAQLETARAREASVLARLRGVEQTAAQMREKSTKELRELGEACAKLRARAEAADVRTREEISRDRAKLAEIVQQKDEAAKRLLQKCRKEHEAALVAERDRAQENLRAKVDAAIGDHRHQADDALSALSLEKDRELRRALEAKGLELRIALDEAVASEAQRGAEARAEAALALAAVEERLARMSKESEAEGARLRKAIAVAVAERDTALQKAREKAREELEAEWEGRGRAEVAEKVARVTADAERVTSRKLEEAVVRGKEETRRAVEAAEMRKDREMAKALKAAGRVSLRSQRETQAALEAEKLRYAREQDGRLRAREDTHREEIDAWRDKVKRAVREAESATAAAEAAGVKISALEGEVEKLVGRLSSLPGELRAELEREFDERERRAREEVRDEMRAQFDVQTSQKESDTREELEQRLALAKEELVASHEAALHDSVAAVAAEKDALVAEARESLKRSEERCQAVAERAAWERRVGEEQKEEVQAAVEKDANCRHRQELEEALASLAAEHRAAMAVEARRVEREKNEAVAIARATALDKAAAERIAAEERVVEATDRRNKQKLEEALESLKAEHHEVLAAANARSKRDRDDAVAAARAVAIEESAAERKFAEERAAETRDRRNRQELEEALDSLAAEHRKEMAASAAKAERDRDEAVATARATTLEEADEERRAAGATDRRHKQKLEEALHTITAEHRKAMAAAALKAERDRNEAVAFARATALNEAVAERRAIEERAIKASDRRHRKELEEALGSLADEHRAAMAVAAAKAEKYRDEAVATARVTALEEAAAERRAAEIRTAEAVEKAETATREDMQIRVEELERQAREESERRRGRDAEDVQRLADEVAGAVKAAVEEERRRLAKQHAKELERVARDGALATRAATETATRKEDARVVALKRRVEEEAERRRAAEAAMEQAAKNWGMERAAALAEQDRAHHDAVQAALTALASEKDAALEAAVSAEKMRAIAAEEREAFTAARAAEAKKARTAAMIESQAASKAMAEAEVRARRHEGEDDERRRLFRAETERRAREEVARVREEAEMAAEEERSRTSEELGRLRNHSSSLLQSLRAAQDATAAEAERARRFDAEAESLRREVALLADETVAIRENASRREEQHRQDLAEAEQTKQAAELAEVAAREEAAAAVERLEAAAREQRERTETENAESLTRALEEMERQQSGVLSAALARSDAALREVARVKEAMWNKAEENAVALREAFEEAAERAAEEAEQATADALAKAERDFEEKLTRALAARTGHEPRRSGERSTESAVATFDDGSDARMSRAEREEALRQALASQRTDYERRLEAALVERDAEALEALRLLDAQHRDAASKNGFVPPFTGTANACRGSDGSVGGDISSGEMVSDAVVAFGSDRVGRKKGDRRRPRPARSKPAGADGARRASPSVTPLSSKGMQPRSSAARGTPSSAKVTASVIRSAVAERDAALLEVREVSGRLEEALYSVAGSERFSPPSSPLSNAIKQEAPDTPAHVQPPFSVRSEGASGEDMVGGAPHRLDGDTTINSCSSNSFSGLAGGRAASADRSEASSDAAPAWTVGSVSPAARGGEDAGLTPTEKRYRRELKTLQARVHEMEGMMEERLEERERLYRRKLRAAVSECRALRVQKHGSAKESAIGVNADRRGPPPAETQRDGPKITVWQQK